MEQGTLGITGLYLLRVLTDGEFWHLDVGLARPWAVSGPKGFAVRKLIEPL